MKWDKWIDSKWIKIQNKCLLDDDNKCKTPNTHFES
jgi:hypothetical protein